jgi:Protein of unknown function (DUF3102)
MADNTVPFTPPSTPKPDGLADLAAQIKSYHKAVEDAGKNMVDKAIAAGVALNAAKRQVAHGSWLPWLEKHCELSERTANRYMKLANGKSKIEQKLRAKSATMADLTLAEAERLTEDEYEKVQATLIKKLRGLSPEDVEEAATKTIAELERVVEAVKNPAAS